MDEQAIRRIEQLVTTNASIDFDHEPAVALPEGMRLHDLERYQDMPRRQRATFETMRVTDFINYVAPQAVDDKSIVVIAGDGSEARAIIDFGDSMEPMWKENRAILSSQKTPAYQALIKMTERPLRQRDLVDWIEDWREIVEACDADGNEIAMGRAMAAIRRVTIKRARDTTSSDDDMAGSLETLDSVSAQGADDGLPAFFRVHTPMFEDMATQELRVRLSLRTSDDVPAFGLRIVAHEQIKRDVAEELESTIRDALPSLRVFVGEITSDALDG